MTSHARPCYQLLSHYTQNGLNPIMVPTPSESVYEVEKLFTFHDYDQKKYEDHKKLSMQKNGIRQTRKGYYIFGSIPENNFINCNNSSIIGTTRYY